MANPLNLPQNGNSNNSTQDERVIWEDGTWAIIEAGDCWDGLPRSQTRDSLGDAVSSKSWDPNRTSMPGPQSVTDKKLVKVKLQDLLGNVGKVTPQPTGAGFPMPKAFRAPTPPDTPQAPPSPFLPKPWQGRAVPEFPHTCRVCGGRYYQGLNKVIHEATENTALDGNCPGSPQIKTKPGKSKWP